MNAIHRLSNGFPRHMLALAAVCLIPIVAAGQTTGSIQGRVYNRATNEPIPFANIQVWGTSIGSSSDFDGNFLFAGLQPGFVELRVSAVGFKPYVSGAIMVTNARVAFIDMGLEETAVEIQEVTVRASPFRRSEESPVSLHRIGIDEIEKNPGGNRDISRVIQSLPGVASTAAFRNDVIVRGGGPGENRFFLDGVEIPNLNHFATQGASGGPVGIINADFIREANFYTGAFPASKGNALSSVLDLRQVDGNRERMRYRAALGASDLALTLDGPLSPSTTLILSARRSYLQLLFSALELPFLPTYNGFQFKSRTSIDERNEISVVGLGAIDQFRLNTGLANPTPNQRFILSFVPVNTQWNYTLGVVYKHFGDRGVDTWVISRNMLNNRQFKYRDNNTDDIMLLDYLSQESENKFRYEHDRALPGGLKLSYGGGAELARYTNRTDRLAFANGAPLRISYDTRLRLFKWSLFGQASQSLVDERLTLSLGLRMDANSYSARMANPLRQLSPRLAASFEVLPGMFVNSSVARYYQHPPYTMLGFAGPDGTLVNRENGLEYIQSDQLVGGMEWLPNPNSRLSLEGFHKWYSQYPFSLTDSISMASKGGTFGTFGDEPVISTSSGRAYGAELLYRHRDLFGFNTILSYTLVWSESLEQRSSLRGSYIPTAWDNRHLITLTATRTFGRNWDLGFRWRFVGGAPFTPWDLATSSLITAWDAQGRGYLDFSRFNSGRLRPYHQLDLRVDRMFFLRQWTLSLYVDVQNVYAFPIDSPENIIVAVDRDGNRRIDPNDPSRYVLETIPNDSRGNILPTVGVIVEF